MNQLQKPTPANIGVVNEPIFDDGELKQLANYLDVLLEIDMSLKREDRVLL